MHPFVTAAAAIEDKHQEFCFDHHPMRPYRIR
jgi:hypothetical protein